MLIIYALFYSCKSSDQLNVIVEDGKEFSGFFLVIPYLVNTQFL